MTPQEIEVSRWEMLARWVEAMRAKAAGEVYDKAYDEPNYMHDMMNELMLALPQEYVLEQAEAWKDVPRFPDGKPMDISKKLCKRRRLMYLMMAANNTYVNSLKAK